jgi:hypothetical protein
MGLGALQQIARRITSTWVDAPIRALDDFAIDLTIGTYCSTFYTTTVAQLSHAPKSYPICGSESKCTLKY